MRHFALAIAVLTAGCGSYGQALSYRGVGADRIVSGERTWRIFDKQDERRLLIMPPIARAFGQGVVRGLTFSALEPGFPKPDYQAAVVAWLAHTGRANCIVVDGYELIESEWEFTYRCEPGLAPMLAPMPQPRRPSGGAFPPVTSSGNRL